MRAAALLVLAACAHAPTPDVKLLSHDIVDAYDHGKLAVVEPQLAPGFVHSEEGEPHDREKELEGLKKWKSDEPHVAERTWSDEHVFVKGNEAVFVGRALEKGSGKHSYSYDGRYTLAWHYEDGAWKLALWTWNRAGEMAERDTWNDIFKHGTGYEVAPNKLLVETVEKLTPGAALDIASGQGRNVVFLASKGWTATGIDFSHEGNEQARAAAKAKSLNVEILEQDVDTADLGTAKYELVTLIYAGNDPKVIAKAQQALKPGGTFVCEYFHATTPDDKHDFQTGELAKAFAGYEIVRDEIVEDTPDWAKDRASLVRFVARKR
jgi:2-polyprenyl-3-methyl-5-hydroxy-6-metoxy-1,4-benzoquinol methylase